jgi:hypothetical protein
MLQEFIVIHQAQIAAVLAFIGYWCAIASLINRYVWPQPPATANHWLRLLHEVLIDQPSLIASKAKAGVFTIPGLNWSITIPFLVGSLEPGDKKPVVALAAASLLPVLFAGALLSGCTFCAQAANAGSARCIAQQVSIDCGVPAIEQAALDILPAVVARINGQAVDWKAIGELELTHNGLPTVACAVQMAEKLAGSSAAPDLPATKIDAGLVAAIIDHREDVRRNADEYYAARRIRFKTPLLSLFGWRVTL